MTLGGRLKQLREERGITAEQLANELKLLKTVVWGFEMDKKEPTASQLLKYGDFFGVSVDYLIGRNENASVGNLSLDGEGLRAQFLSVHGEEVTDEEITEAVTYIKAKRMVMEALQR
jgi:transcriptional regulator with XRE-family HTH domain